LVLRIVHIGTKEGQMEYSKNEQAGRLMGFRPKGVTALIEPAELGYHCPVCQNSPRLPNGEPDPRLTWSEYNIFIWCEVCNRDFPSCLCLGDIGTATEVFLDSVRDAIGLFIQCRGPIPNKPDWWPKNPYPIDVFPMPEERYPEIVPDPDLRTALSGMLGRQFWDIASEAIWEAMLEAIEVVHIGT